MKPSVLPFPPDSTAAIEGSWPYCKTLALETSSAERGVCILASACRVPCCGWTHAECSGGLGGCSCPLSCAAHNSKSFPFRSFTILIWCRIEGLFRNIWNRTERTGRLALYRLRWLELSSVSGCLYPWPSLVWSSLLRLARKAKPPCWSLSRYRARRQQGSWGDWEKDSLSVWRICRE